MSNEAKEAAIAAIELHERLIERFALVSSGAPFWKTIYETQHARLSIDDDDATISWPEADSCYDSCTINEECVTIPAALLFISDDELETWKDEQEAIANQKAMTEKAAFDRSVEAGERAALVMLKAKYEPQP